MTPTFFFGFHTEDEKKSSLKLISVSGIGPTTALAIVAVDDNQAWWLPLIIVTSST